MPIAFWPSAARMPLEVRLTLDFMPTDYEHLHQTRPSNSGRCIRFHCYDQTCRGGFGLLSSLLPDPIYIPDFDADFQHLCWRYCVGLSVILRFIAAPTRRMGDTLWSVHQTMIPFSTVLSRGADMTQTGGPRLHARVN